LDSAADDDRKVESPDSDFRPRLRHAKSAKSIDPRTDPKRLLEYLFETLCSLRATSKAFDLDFLAYLIEMAALEAENELKLKIAEEEPEPKKDPKLNP